LIEALSIYFFIFLSLQRKSARQSRYEIATVNSKLARAVYNDLILYIRPTFCPYSGRQRDTDGGASKMLDDGHHPGVGDK
jgi:hypothetical protein